MGGLRQTATTLGAKLAIALLAIALVVSVSQSCVRRTPDAPLR